ncbi:MAG: prepilin peptidase [Firmicutes bacterium]|nr:prepilin peptidase [Bacillota bacterium]
MYNKNMVNNVIEILIITAVSLPLGIFLGCGAVYVFNRLPAKWLCDYEEEPSAELLDMSVQRVKSFPNKMVFSALFAVLGIFLGVHDYVFAFTALFELWLLLMIAIADKKYMIIPDQFVIFLVLFSFPMSVYRVNVIDMVWGMCLGGGVMLVAAAAGKFMVKREALGFGDVKLMAAVGLTAGLSGTAFILALSSIISCAAFVYKLVCGRIKRYEALPLGPYIALATTVYIFIQGSQLERTILA